MSTRQKVFRVLPLERSIGTSSSGAELKRRRRSSPPDDDWLTPAMRRAVDDWAAAQPDPKPSRTEAIRRLLERGLAG